MLWTEEPGELQSMGMQRIRQDLVKVSHMSVMSLVPLREIKQMVAASELG